MEHRHGERACLFFSSCLSNTAVRRKKYHQWLMVAPKRATCRLRLLIPLEVHTSIHTADVLLCSVVLRALAAALPSLNTSTMPACRACCVFRGPPVRLQDFPNSINGTGKDPSSKWREKFRVHKNKHMPLSGVSNLLYAACKKSPQDLKRYDGTGTAQ